MSHSAHVKATHKAIQTYYQTLKDYHEHDVGHETALRSAFQNLLAETAVVHVSVETTRIVAGLPENYTG
jgi:hypothetical protein